MQFINLNKCTFCTGWEDLNCYLECTYKSRIRLPSDLDLFFNVVFCNVKNKKIEVAGKSDSGLISPGYFYLNNAYNPRFATPLNYQFVFSVM